MLFGLVLSLNNLKVLEIHILGEPGAVSWDDAIFSGKQYLIFRRKFTSRAEEASVYKKN